MNQSQNNRFGSPEFRIALLFLAGAAVFVVGKVSSEISRIQQEERQAIQRAAAEKRLPQTQAVQQPAPLSKEAKDLIGVADVYIDKSRAALDIARQYSELNQDYEACGQYVEASNNVRRAQILLNAQRIEIQAKKPEAFQTLRDLLKTKIDAPLEKCKQRGYVSSIGAQGISA